VEVSPGLHIPLLLSMILPWYKVRSTKKKRISFQYKSIRSWILTLAKTKKSEKNNTISTGVSGVSGGSLCNRLVCPLLA